MKPISRQTVDEVLQRLDIVDIGRTTIRQCVNVSHELEWISGEKFVHLEFGIPGMNACKVGLDAQKEALDNGAASVYPPSCGIHELKENGSRFIKAFVGVEISPEGIVPTVGSMQGCYNLLLECIQMNPEKDTVVYLNPGFPSHYVQAKVLGIKTRMFDLYDFRGDKFREKLEEVFRDGCVSAIVYSNPNNPSWVCLTEDELKSLGELCTKYDVIALEDMAYMCMDFRKDLSMPFLPPFQPTVARYTDNCVLMISASKIFSYAGERIAMVAISDKLYKREYLALRERYGIGRFGDNFSLTYLYVNSSSCSHSAQYAFAEMLGSAADGKYDFVGQMREYGRRAGKAKEIFLRHGFYIVYDKDLGEDVSDGFFFTIGYDGLTGSQLLLNLLRCGICAITLVATRSTREGIRVCVSLLNSEKDFSDLDERLGSFERLMMDENR
ncbi:MAG TPA: aminotransferase [Rikenellaceae bacterium]|nr:aminotransferase [Rikenellaceae bacterium]